MNLDGEIVALMKRNAVRVPPCPKAALEVRAVLARADHEVNEVVEAVKKDPTLAAAVLRVSNSVFFRRDQPATTLKAAVQRVGERELERLALAAGLSGELLRAGPLAELRRATWRQAMTTAVVCEALARARGDLSAEEAFVVGLLCDIGKLVAVGAAEQILVRHPGEPARARDEWAAIIERYHVELGLVLATRWGLPDVVSDVISQHHESRPCGAFAWMVELVATGTRITTLLEAGSPVTPEALSTISWFRTPEERQALAAMLVEVPVIVAGFAPDEPPGSEASMVLEPPPSPARPAARFDVVLPGRGVSCAGLALQRGRVQFVSPAPLATNFLAQLELRQDGVVVSAWTRVTSCRPSQGMHVVEAAPFALSGVALEGWLRLASTQPAPTRRDVGIPA